MILSCLFLLPLLLCVDAAGNHHGHAKKALPPLKSLHGIAHIRSESGDVDGTLYFSQYFNTSDSPVRIRGEVFGLDDVHGITVNQWGNISKKCESTGEHFNPDWTPHGAPNEYLRHVGDLGNIEEGEVDITDFRISLIGRNSIYGRSIVIYELMDDAGDTEAPSSATTGNAGAKIACGIIGKTDFEYGVEEEERK